MVTDYEAAVKKIIPNHHVLVCHEKLSFKEHNGNRKLQIPFGVKRKDYQDIWFAFHPIVYTNGYGIF